MDKRQIEKFRKSFDDISYKTEGGVEFWYARELMPNLGYGQWRNFENAIKNAMNSCESAKIAVSDHFAEVSKMIEIGKGGHREVRDYMLTRYACYLIAQNGDPKGVDDAGFGRIRSKGDTALFGGHTTKDMKNRLGVKDNRPLADFLPTLTIAAKNLATEMTNYNVEQKDLQGEMPITDEHVQNNKTVRKMLGERDIKPEELPPDEDIKKLERRVRTQEKKIVNEAGSFGGDSDGET